MDAVNRLEALSQDELISMFNDQGLSDYLVVYLRYDVKTVVIAIRVSVLLSALSSALPYQNMDYALYDCSYI